MMSDSQSEIDQVLVEPYLTKPCPDNLRLTNTGSLEQRVKFYSLAVPIKADISNISIYSIWENAKSMVQAHPNYRVLDSTEPQAQTGAFNLFNEFTQKSRL